jgi:rhamnose utilization protein RhaD (predicted bifunctional aldolase and dehydrogenase)
MNGPASIIELSRFYGRDPGWVIAGGGNASWKDKKTLWVKASGSALADASEDTFVAIDREKLAPMWDKAYSTDTDVREKQALDDLMAARQGGQTLRPSVETGMHDVLPQAFVLHTHPTLVNAVTCSVEGESAARELFRDEFFGDDIVWIPSINPGYVLSKRIFDDVETYRSNHHANPRVVVLQNHGVTVAAEDPEEIHRMHRLLVQVLLPRLKAQPDMGAVEGDLPTAEAVVRALRDIRTESGETETTVLYESPAELMIRAASPDAMAPLMTPFSPDHIVYAGHRPLYLETSTDLRKHYDAFVSAESTQPKIVVVRNVGFFAVGPNRKAAETARMLFRNALEIARYAENFGGAQGMPRAEIDFIRNWEVERFRAKVSLDN